MINAIESLSKFIADVIDGFTEFVGLDALLFVMYVGAGAVVYLAMTGGVPLITGAVALGLLFGGAWSGISQTSSNSEKELTIEKMVPYDSWPNDCYSCNEALGEVRGQFVIHKNEGANNIQAVGLCENCTRTHSTILDYSDKFKKIYDMRGEPEEL